MVKPDAVLLETLTLMLLRTSLYTKRCAAADVIDKIVAVVDFLHAEKRQKLAVEYARCVEIARCQDDVRHAVDLDRHICLRCVLASPQSNENPERTV